MKNNVENTRKLMESVHKIFIKEDETAQDYKNVIQGDSTMQNNALIPYVVFQLNMEKKSPTAENIISYIKTMTKEKINTAMNFKFMENVNEIEAEVNDYIITYKDKNGKSQTAYSTEKDKKTKEDALKSAGNKDITTSKVVKKI